MLKLVQKYLKSVSLMMKKNKDQLFLFTSIPVLLLGLSACSTLDNLTDTKSGINYNKNKTVKVLDFPPDLTAPKYDHAFALPSDGVILASSLTNNKLGINQDSSSVLPNSSFVQAGGIGSSRWLDVKASANTLWPQLRLFWESIGITVKRDEPRIGIMETDWAENSAGLPVDFIRGLLGKFGENSFDAGFRDRYRLRLEKTSNITTRIFLTHRGAEKIVTDVGRGWEIRPAKPELEAELLNRLKAFLQGDTKIFAGKNTTRNRIANSSSFVDIVTQEGRPILQVHNTYQKAWVITGIMLDRMSLVVEDKNQSTGIYKVKYQGDEIDANAKQGFFTRLLTKRKTLLSLGEDYQVHVRNAGKLTAVRITDKDGKPLAVKQSRVVLARLKKEFDR